MQSSLFTGISGLNANLGALNVIGNNIANVNTIGFKASRVAFADILSQTLEGNNQIGLGVNMSSVDQVFSQGAFETTGNTLDMGVSGDGFFMIRDAILGTNFYTRTGQFSIDKQGFVVNPQGLRVQGYMANTTGNLGNTIEDVVLLTNTVAPNTTSSVEIVANLNSNSPVTGFVFSSGLNEDILFSPDGGTTILRADLVADGGLVSGTAYDGGSVSAAIKAALEASSKANGFTRTFSVGFDDQTGIFEIKNDLLNVANLDLYWSESTVATGGAGALSFAPTDITGTVPGSTTTGTGSVGTLSGIIITTDKNNTISFSPDGGTTSVTADLIADGGLLSGVTYSGAQIATAAELALETAALAATGTAYNYSVTYNGGTGALTFGNNIGNPGNLDLYWSTSPAAVGGVPVLGYNTVDALGITVTNSDTSDISAGSFFLDRPGETSNFSTPITVYDSLGNPHVVTTYFRKNELTSTGNAWNWYSIVGGEDSFSGNSEVMAQGTITFNTSGSLFSETSVAYPTGGFDFTGGAIQDQLITFDFGASLAQGGNGTDGTTQYGSTSAVSGLNQDGFAAGTLQRISVDQDGVITGIFSNGRDRKLAQVLLADFPSQRGLATAGNNNWLETFDSGQPNVGAAGSAGRGLIQSSTLELSNVDIATEFVKMITAQRGFQANSRTITTTDDVLNELVNLKR